MPVLSCQTKIAKSQCSSLFLGGLLMLPRCRLKYARDFFDIPLFQGSAHQGIADPWYGQNVARIARVGFDLLAEMADVGFDETAIPVVAKSPDVRNDLTGRADIVGIHCQQMQQFAFS